MSAWCTRVEAEGEGEGEGETCADEADMADMAATGSRSRRRDDAQHSSAAEEGATGTGRGKQEAVYVPEGHSSTAAGRAGGRWWASSENARMPAPRSAEGVTGRMRLAVGAAWWRVAGRCSAWATRAKPAVYSKWSARAACVAAGSEGELAREARRAQEAARFRRAQGVVSHCRRGA
jgi:hypothetical protein